MQVPLELSFHNMPPSTSAELEIQARVAKLEKRFGRLISCRVRVDRQTKGGSGSQPPVVRIELGVPGRREIVVSQEPEQLSRRFKDPDLGNAIHEAFDSAERQLIDIKNQMQGTTKRFLHDGENQRLGEVAELPPGEDHGFLLTNTGGLLYFHRNSLLSGDFDRLRRGDAVYYVETDGDTGPTAGKVRVKA